MPNKIFQREFHLDCFLLNHEGKASLVTYFNLMQEVALKHADILGFGAKDMHQNKMLWVLTRMGIEVYESLNWDELIKVKTWSRGIEGAYSFREFLFFNSRDEIIGKASSSWVPIDLISRRPTKVFDDQKINSIAHQENVGLELSKILLPKNLESAYTHTVRPSDLDINNHANNARYVEWIYNCLPLNYYQGKKGFKFQISYLGEAKLNDQIEITHAKNLNGQYVFSGKDTKEGRPIFSAALI